MGPATKRILEAINSRAFSRWSVGPIAIEAACSREFVYRVLHDLEILKMVRHLPMVRGWRRWEVTSRWFNRSFDDVLSDYEWADRSGVFSPSEKLVKETKR